MNSVKKSIKTVFITNKKIRKTQPKLSKITYKYSTNKDKEQKKDCSVLIFANFVKPVIKNLFFYF